MVKYYPERTDNRTDDPKKMSVLAHERERRKLYYIRSHWDPDPSGIPAGIVYNNYNINTTIHS